MWIWENGADALAQAEDNVSNYVSPGLNVRNCNVTKFSFGIFSSHNKATNIDEETFCSGYIYPGFAWNCCNFTISQEIMLFKPLNQVELGTDYLWPKLPIKPFEKLVSCRIKFIFSPSQEEVQVWLDARRIWWPAKRSAASPSKELKILRCLLLFCWIRKTNRP